MQDIRIAAVVCRCPAGQVTYNLERTAHWTAYARKRGAAIVCLPELNISGYQLSAHTCQTAEIGAGAVCRQLQHLADAEDVVILAGVAEKKDARQMFVTHLVLTPGGPVQAYRKLHIAPPEQAFFAAGDTIPVFKAAGVRFGIQLCYDTHFPELSTRMALAGAQILFMPHASPRGTPADKYQSWLRHLPARAFDNSCFVVACNQCGDNAAGLSFPGLALVIGPSGTVIARRLKDREGVLLADLKTSDYEEVRGHRMRFFLPHRRDDLYAWHDSGPASPSGLNTQPDAVFRTVDRDTVC